MYENIYAYNEKFNGKEVWVIFKPNFREELTLFNGENKIFSDGEIKMKGELVLNGTRSKFPDVYTSENAQWVLEDEGYAIRLFVTERTHQIMTPLGEEWNKEFNWLLKKCKDEYYKKKKQEIRLYFYNAEANKLQLYFEDMGYYEFKNYNYSLRRLFPIDPFCKIDKRCSRPEKNCFILGRIRKTIGLKNSKLLDFIEPVDIIPLDFEKEKFDFGGYEYKENISDLQKKVYELLKFSITKEYNPLSIARIQAYFKCESKEPKFIAGRFTIEIMDAFNAGDTKKVRKLYEVLNKCQDCTDASGIYLGETRDRYNFY